MYVPSRFICFLASHFAKTYFLSLSNLFRKLIVHFANCLHFHLQRFRHNTKWHCYCFLTSISRFNLFKDDPNTIIIISVWIQLTVIFENYKIHMSIQNFIRSWIVLKIPSWSDLEKNQRFFKVVVWLMI